jgi:hypothetical protein
MALLVKIQVFQLLHLRAAAGEVELTQQQEAAAQEVVAGI